MDTRRWTSGVLLAFFGGAVLASQAGATSIVRLGMRDMVAASSSIVHGTVVAATSRWNEDHTMIVTDVRVRVSETLKGAPAREVVVTQPGGRVGKLQTEVAGAYAFAPGEETVLFLTPGTGGGLHVAGLMQGRFDIVTDAKSGRKSVQGMSLEGVDLVSKGGTQALEAPEKAQAPRDLGSFLGDVRALVHDVKAKGGK